MLISMLPETYDFCNHVDGVLQAWRYYRFSSVRKLHHGLSLGACLLQTVTQAANINPASISHQAAIIMDETPAISIVAQIYVHYICRDSFARVCPEKNFPVQLIR